MRWETHGHLWVLKGDEGEVIDWLTAQDNPAGTRLVYTRQSDKVVYYDLSTAKKFTERRHHASALPCDHDDAFQWAESKRAVSNVARCYLDLRRKVRSIP